MLAAALRRTEPGGANRRNQRPGLPGGRPSEARGPALGISWLDVKLGLRMLLKHPVLTGVSALAMSVTIAIAIAMFSLFQDFLLRPTIPLPEGDRIVSLGMLTTDRGRTYRQLLHDWPVWRDELETIEEVSIWRHARGNLVGPDGTATEAVHAMMTASGFEVARTPPLMGRPLLPGDERPGATPVMVIGYDEWVRRYDADPDVLGRTVRIGRDRYTIVGVMPEEFGFPFAERRWIPFTDDPDDFAVMETPYSYFAFGRLRDGVTMEAAQDELDAISARRARNLPESHERVRAIVMSYTDTHTGMDNAGSLLPVRIMIGVLSLLVLIPFVNVAILVYARTATRAGEISIRSALGASRRRVVTQLFVEALVLAGLAAVAGVSLVVYGMALAESIVQSIGDGGAFPFWARKGRDPWVVAYVVGLTLTAAVVAGVVPGLKATGRGVQAGLRRWASGNGMRLGGVWTALIVAQVATTVAFLPFVASAGWELIGFGLTRPSFDAEELASARIGGPVGIASAEALSRPDPTGARAAERERVRQAIEEVVRRLQADERVTAVTLSTDVPGRPFGNGDALEVDGVPPPIDRPAHRVDGEMLVLDDFFEVLGVEATVGRLFHATDVSAEVPPVVVNRAFVDEVLDGANAVGRRVRSYRSEGEEPAPWRQIVGVVGDLVVNPTHPDHVEPRIYSPYDRASVARGVFLTVRVPGGVERFVPEVRRIVTDVDPTLRLGTVRPLGRLDDTLASMTRAALAGFVLVLVAALLLSTAGVFSLMSFNVTQRRREIGVRSALGAEPRRVLVSVMGRSARQVAVGIGIGLVVVAAIPPIPADGFTIEASRGPTAVVAVIMLLVGLFAAIGPARRGLAIQPSEALREG